MLTRDSGTMVNIKTLDNPKQPQSATARSLSKVFNPLTSQLSIHFCKLLDNDLPNVNFFKNHPLTVKLLCLV